MQISITVSGKSYTISLNEQEIDNEVECIKKYISLEKDNDVKTLLYAYVKRCFEYVKLEKELKKTIVKVESSIR